MTVLNSMCMYNLNHALVICQTLLIHEVGKGSREVGCYNIFPVGIYVEKVFFLN